jgi:hypothetical protein
MAQTAVNDSFEGVLRTLLDIIDRTFCDQVPELKDGIEIYR